MKYEYGLELLTPWVGKLRDRNSSGMIIGLPKSGRKRTIAEVFRRLDLEDELVVVDAAKRNPEELQRKLQTVTISGVKFVYVDGLDLGRGEDRARIEDLLILREEFGKEFSYIFAPKGDPLISPERFKGVVVNTDVIYFPYAQGGEFGKLISQNEARYAVGADESQKDRILLLSGGCPFVVKALFRRLAEGKNLEIDEELEMVGLAWLEDLGREDRGLISKVTNLAERERGSLIRRGFLTMEGEIRSELARVLLGKGKLRGRRLGVNESGTLVLDEEIVERPFSPAERDVLSLLLGAGIVKREKIAQLCFPDGDYSEEALDQVMSRIRKKLRRVGVDATSLITLKKVGYEWRREEESAGI